jgi:hypothetical protein
MSGVPTDIDWLYSYRVGVALRVLQLVGVAELVVFADRDW